MGSLQQRDVPASQLSLSQKDLDMLDGIHGRAAQQAMRIIVRMAEVQQATELVDISHVHIGGSIYTGKGSLKVIEELVSNGAKVRVPTTVNSISIDRSQTGAWNSGNEFDTNAGRLATALEAMGANPIFSCTPYVFPKTPQFGQNILWAESNAIVYANSVIGARTNRHGDFMDVCAALTGRVPNSGLHLSENRHGTLLVNVPDVVDVDPTFYTVLGYLIGKHAGADIPVIEGIRQKPSLEELKTFCATLATSGAVGMFHMVGVTPEAPTLEAALGHVEPQRRLDVTKDQLRQVWNELSSASSTTLNMVAMGSPHATLGDLAELGALVRGKKKHPQVEFLVTTSRFVRDQAQELGIVKDLDAFGVRISTDTCLCMFNPRRVPSDASGIMTNSGKFAHYGPGLTGRGIYFGTAKDCVDSAIAGMPLTSEPEWLRS
jgi:cis-L-3-hydroxyproline dehydratase